MERLRFGKYKTPPDALSEAEPEPRVRVSFKVYTIFTPPFFPGTFLRSHGPRLGP